MTTSASGPVIPVGGQDLITAKEASERIGRPLPELRSVPGNARLQICQDGLRRPCWKIFTNRGNFKLDLPETKTSPVNPLNPLQQVILRFLTGPGGQTLLKYTYRYQNHRTEEEEEVELKPTLEFNGYSGGRLITLIKPKDDSAQLLNLKLTEAPPADSLQPQAAQPPAKASGQPVAPTERPSKPQSRAPQSPPPMPAWMTTGLWAAGGLALALLAAAAVAWRQRKSS